ncbi:MAG: hypothetical protein J5883_03965, partial [Clostridiales bacterium]|nr:hypothetical protein [Clostridiales bacterium]
MNDHTRKISIDPVFLAVSFFLSLFAGGLTWLYLSSPVPAGFVLLLCTALSYFILTFIKSRIKDDVFTKDPISDITGKEILFITVSSFIM